ncbi:MAG: cytochrome c-type biogenesis protein CcmH [Alphaproteobacteria bacterium]
MVIDEKINDPILEQKAKSLFKNIRCAVCQGQAIDESATSFAHDLRKFIRSEFKSGKSTKDIELYLVKTFGEDIILTPQFTYSTYFLWISPIFFLIIGVFFIKNYFKK